MDSKKKICPYCGEEIMSAARKCKHCGEWLDNANLEAPNNNAPENKPHKEAAPKSKKEKMLNGVIALLIIANLTVAFFWIKDCLTPKSIIGEDVEKVSKLMTKKDLSTRIDSVSYALGSWCADNTPNVSTIKAFDDMSRIKFYAGMLRGSLTPQNQARNTIISEALQHVNPDIEKYSTVGELNGDAIFQGVYDGATSGRTYLLTNEELQSISQTSFKFQ